MSTLKTVSSSKLTRTYVICTGPIIVATEGEVSVVQPVIEHKIDGCQLKYAQAPDGCGMVHVLDKNETIVFSTPTNNFLWSRIDGTCRAPMLELLNNYEEISDEEVEEE